MKATTYTVLVTIAHEDEAPSTVCVAAQIQQGLEEGTREYPSVISAAVDVMEGFATDQTCLPSYLQAKKFHADLQRNP